MPINLRPHGRKSSARSYANKALGFQPSLGRAYLLIANLYADSANDCGDSQFNKRAVYWLAADFARKAGKVNSSLKKVANKTAESYTVEHLVKQIFLQKETKELPSSLAAGLIAVLRFPHCK